MDEKQFQTIVGLIAGLNYALAATVDHLVNRDPARREEVAKHLRATAMLVPPETQNREVITTMIKQLASALSHIQDQGDAPPMSDEIRKFLH